MLQHTFIHADGIDQAAERGLWSAGARTWDDFLDLCGTRPFPGIDCAELTRTLRQSRLRLGRSDARYFAERLPGGEEWRLLDAFAGRTAYVDIETTGLSPNYHEITVVAMWDGERCQTFVRGRDLHRFPQAVSRFPLVVTYNGAAFDFRFLRKAFPSFAPQAHVDLMYPLRRLGLTGGLKGVERALGLARPGEVADMDGREAVMLWHRWERGNRAALKKLLTYASCDVKHLEPLARHVGRMLPRRLGATWVGGR